MRWPQDYRDALARAASLAAQEQRAAARQGDLDLRAWLAGSGCQVVELAPDQRSAFEAAAQPVLELARRRLDTRLFDLIPA